MENALKKYLEKSEYFSTNNFGTEKDKEIVFNNSNSKLWNGLSNKKIDLFEFNIYQFKLSEEEVDSDLNKFPMKIIFSELLKKRNSKSCK